MRPALALVLVTACAGCAAPPEVDLTPRYVVGDSRTESIETYAAIRTLLVDVVAHTGFSWRARVKEVGPEGAVISCTMSRVVFKMPALYTFDSDELIPFGSLLPIGQLLFKLLGGTFEYTVSPNGEVRLRDWGTILKLASAATAVAVPVNGSVPDEHMVAAALSRMQEALPRRLVRLGESWERGVDYHLTTAEQGPRLRCTDSYRYAGWGELEELEFGADEVDVDGLGVPALRGKPDVTHEGLTLLGLIGLQQGRRTSTLVVSEDGGQILGFHEATRLKIMPLPSFTLPAALISFEAGWVFFADEWTSLVP